jgi:hypothetical protein
MVNSACCREFAMVVVEPGQKSILRTEVGAGSRAPARPGFRAGCANRALEVVIAGGIGRLRAGQFCAITASPCEPGLPTSKVAELVAALPGRSLNVGAGKARRATMGHHHHHDHGHEHDPHPTITITITNAHGRHLDS